MAIKETDVKTIQDLVKLKNLTIPNYQRPYKWQTKHVEKLLNDIEKHRKKDVSKYRIGTIVIHQESENEPRNIVDGQQRITTLALILHALGETENNLFKKNNDNENKEKGLNYNHKISKHNIYNNYQNIKSFIESLEDKKEAFKNFLLNNCEVVYIVLDDIDEAFQFFDSQNARGKELEAYDLLKAFHLRETAQDTEEENEEVLELVKQWRDADKHGILKIIFEDLYAIRKWLRGENTSKTKNANEDFIKKDVDEFKGIVFDKKYNYPYLKKISSPDCYFAIDREIFNGSLFFKMILHYVELYKKIFNLKKQENDEKIIYVDKFLELDFLKDIKDRIIKNIKRNKHRDDKTIQNIYNDKGTRFVFTTMLFKRVYLFYVDKFGENDLEKAIEVCFKWAGELLGKHGTLKYKPVQDEGKSLLKRIKYAVEHTEITN